MKRNKSLQYLIGALVTFIIGIVSVIVIAVALFGMSTPIKNNNNQVVDIIDRTVSVVGVNDGSELAKSRVSSGVLSVGDYLIRSFTSADYLMLDKSDSEFATDLVYVLYGETDKGAETDILNYLDGHTRMYAINEAVKDVSRRYEATSDISDESGDSFENCVVTKPLEGDSYTIGIRLVEGSFETTGDEVRTDFFVDGVFYQGNLKIDDDSPEDGTDFVMSWDTAEVESGNHSVMILLRSSDGRGSIIAGGQILVPNRMTLVNDRVQRGSIDMSSPSSWYVLDAADRDAYINFVGLSGDIKVTLYDAYGEVIGANDLPGSEYEILRGHKQDVDAIREQTGLMTVSNTYYICVERGATFDSVADSVDYTMVQSRNVAVMEGQYYAVIDEVGAVPTNPPIADTSNDYVGTSVRLVDLNNNVISVNYENISFLPLEGFLTDLSVKDTGTGVGINVFPSFDKQSTNYGYYTPALNSCSLDFLTQEGYACDVVIKANGNDINISDPISLVPGDNTISVIITSFSGGVSTYNIYLLNGDDNGSFSEDTLSDFPESYYSGLWLLHNIHPEYIFRAYNTGLDFDTVLDHEDSADRSLANYYSHPLWCQYDSPVYDGGGWKAAENSVVRYFLDPRNYLDPQHIFSFELLSFDESSQTLQGVSNVVSGSFLADTSEYNYPEIIFEAGRTANVSPYFIASRILQEMGYSGESALCHGTLPGYEGYFNFYNIGSTPDPSIENGALINGARYAMWGVDPDLQEISEVEASLLLPWDNVEDAITGGALWIASRYTEAGQDTLYFQKFDVIDNEDGLYEHQYAQNISMAYTEGARYFNGYASIGMIENPFVFVIPVYNNMPTEYGVMPAAY